jgi:hypothetical protein
VPAVLVGGMGGRLGAVIIFVPPCLRVSAPLVHEPPLSAADSGSLF